MPAAGNRVDDDALAAVFRKALAIVDAALPMRADIGMADRTEIRAVAFSIAVHELIRTGGPVTGEEEKDGTRNGERHYPQPR